MKTEECRRFSGSVHAVRVERERRRRCGWHVLTTPCADNKTRHDPLTSPPSSSNTAVCYKTLELENKSFDLSVNHPWYQFSLFDHILVSNNQLNAIVVDSNPLFTVKNRLRLANWDFPEHLLFFELSQQASHEYVFCQISGPLLGQRRINVPSMSKLWTLGDFISRQWSFPESG